MNPYSAFFIHSRLCFSVKMRTNPYQLEALKGKVIFWDLEQSPLIVEIEFYIYIYIYCVLILEGPLLVVLLYRTIMLYIT